MIPILSREEMRAFDSHAIEKCRVPSLVLMENAGRGAADVIERELLAGSARGRRVLVVCGPGNNGGDGFVVARHLLGRGASVEAFLAGDVNKQTPDCRTNHAAFTGVGGKLVETDLAKALRRADIVVDALFGTGLDRAITSPFAETVRAINEAGRPVAALDVPSGLDANTGAAQGLAIEAEATISFAHLKLGHMTGNGARLSGPVHVVDIGVPSSLLTARSASLVEASDVRACILPRAIDTHKYRAGHVAVFAGSKGKTGAALLAAQGALRAGAGAATIATWKSAAKILEARIPEVMVTALGGDIEESVDAIMEGKRAIVIGPGFGTDDDARRVAERVLAKISSTIVADADAISLHAGKPEAFAAADGRAILTPHTGELARLLGQSSSAIESNRFGAAREAARRANAVVLLKGAYTVVANPGGEVVVVGAGSPALATAGSGDVLAGIIGALACTLAPFEAAWCGAFLHGVSGSAWQKEHGDRGLLAGEIAVGLPAVIAALHA